MPSKPKKKASVSKPRPKHSAKTPVALAASREVLTLPMYADLALSDVDDICEIVASCKK